MHTPPANPSESCLRAQDIVISNLEDDVLTDSDRLFLESHVTDCADCADYRQTMGHLTASLDEMEELPVPAGLSDRIMSRIAELPAASTEPVVMGKSRWRLNMPVAAAVLAIALAIPLALNAFHGHDQQPGPTIANGTPHQSVVIPMPVRDPHRASKPNTGDGRQLAAQPKPVSVKSMPEKTVRPVQPTAPTHPAVVVDKHPAASKPAQPKQAANSRVMIAARPKTSTPVALRTRPAAAAGTAQAAPATDTSTLASLPGELTATFASDQNSDVYYDPVSTLVGF